MSHYNELSVKNLWKDLKDDDKFRLYFQDSYANDRNPCREYFFNILNTIYPAYLLKIMNHAASQRYSAEGEANKTQAIKVSDEWYEEL